MVWPADRLHVPHPVLHEQRLTRLMRSWLPCSLVPRLLLTRQRAYLWAGSVTMVCSYRILNHRRAMDGCIFFVILVLCRPETADLNVPVATEVRQDYWVNPPLTLSEHRASLPK